MRLLARAVAKRRAELDEAKAIAQADEIVVALAAALKG